MNIVNTIMHQRTRSREEEEHEQRYRDTLIFTNRRIMGKGKREGREREGKREGEGGGRHLDREAVIDSVAMSKRGLIVQPSL